MLDNNYHIEDLIYKNIFTEDKIPRLLIDPRNGRVIEANKAAALLFGLKGEKLKNEHITDILPIDPQTLLLELTKVLAGNKDFFVLKATSDRFARDILVVYPYRFDLTNTTLVCLAFHEIKKTASTLQTFMLSEDAYKFLLEEVTDMIFITNIDGSILDTNLKAAENLAFNSCEELRQKNLFSDFFVSQDDSIGIIKEIKSKGYCFSRDVTIKDKNNNQKILSFRAQLLSPSNIYGITEDLLLIIVKEKHKVIPSTSPSKAYISKMEALEQISKGISHEFNNILSGIIGFGELLNLHLVNDPIAKTYVEKILLSANRGSKLVQDLSMFAQTAPHNPVLLDINETLIQFRKFISDLLDHNINLEFNLSPKKLMVMADPAHIKTMLLNLFTNAKDAIPFGGTIKISTDLTEIDQKFKKTYGFGEVGTYVLISFTDSGGGIDEELKEKIFVPFFTTKEIGKGTGLGLPIVYGIIKRHNGYIVVESEEGFTTFKVFLPYLSKVIEQSNKKEIESPVSNTETILIIEEDEIVASLIKEILESCKYRVIIASNTKDAIRIVETHSEIKLVILNSKMYKEVGLSIPDVLKSINPYIKIIYLDNGYENIFTNSEEKRRTFIKKPFSAASILTSVKETLQTK